MRTFTDDELAGLIACSKQVVDPPRREMRVDGRMKRNDMTLKSADDKHSFRVFIRQSEEFPENFSFGLIYFRVMNPAAFNSSGAMDNTAEKKFIRIMLYFTFTEAKPMT